MSSSSGATEVGDAEATESPPRRPTPAERFAARELPADERIDFAATAVMSRHPLLHQMLHSLTMGGPRPRTEAGYLEPAHGIVVVTERRLLVLAYGRHVMELPRGLARIEGIGGGTLIPWADVRWGRRTVRTAFHWGRRDRDRFVELIGAR